MLFRSVLDATSFFSARKRERGEDRERRRKASRRRRSAATRGRRGGSSWLFSGEVEGEGSEAWPAAAAWGRGG